MSKFLNEKLVDSVVQSLSDGTIFTVTFQKKDGTRRKMNARFNVTKYLKGGESTTAHIEHLRTVYDNGVQEYRCFDIRKVYSLRAHGASISPTRRRCRVSCSK